MVTGKSDLVDIDGEISVETDKAVLFSHDGKTKVWLPKSQIEIDDTSFASELSFDKPLKGWVKEVQVTMPTWLAYDKGLI